MVCEEKVADGSQFPPALLLSGAELIQSPRFRHTAYTQALCALLGHPRTLTDTPLSVASVRRLSTERVLAYQTAAGSL